ncbi:hypothetical protein V501_09681 [Pseudogymnoascus sp. VKM F-4519 (FW-2642)]|nr:hypothetical protein V501_09681 [Pseudogymnoascus sp. VKM F-4519 (FW-2642)]
MATTYTMAQLQMHTKSDDVWMVLHNKVYDVTKYIEDHPGGAAILVEVAGADATEAFEEAGHSDDARDIMAAYCIGELAEEDHAEEVEFYRPNYEQVSTAPAVDVKKNAPSGRLAHILKRFLKASIVGAAVFGAYRQGYGLPPYTVLLDWLKIQRSGSSGQFWTGFGIATVAQATASVGLLAWAWSKLDVQEEFTHFPAHRQGRKELMVLKKKTEVAKKLPVLDPQKYRKFELTKKVQLSSNVYHFVFALPNATDVLGLPIGQHIAIRADIDGKSVSRSYTPISNDVDLGRIELVVKVYPGGLITNYLAKLNIGDKVEIRGPKGAMKYNKDYSKNILMIAGGTGITPMYQLIRAICTDDSDNTIVKLLYANNTEEDVLLKKQLDAFAAKCPKKFKIEYVLSKPSEGWKGKVGFVTQDLIKEQELSASKDTKVMLCGPPPMINAMKNNLGPLGFQLPGALSRPTDQVFLF